MAKKIIIFLIIVFVIAIIFLRPFSKLRELDMKNKVLTEEIEHLKGVNRALEEEKQALEEDISFIEKRAREKMGVVKEGEIKYKVVPEEH